MYPSIPSNYATYPAAGSQGQTPPPPPVAYANTTTYRPPQQPGYAPQAGPPAVNPQDVLSSTEATGTLRIRLAEEYKIAPPVRAQLAAPAPAAIWRSACCSPRVHAPSPA